MPKRTGQEGGQGGLWSGQVVGNTPNAEDVGRQAESRTKAVLDHHALRHLDYHRWEDQQAVKQPCKGEGWDERWR